MTEKALPNTSEGLFSCAAEGSGPGKNPAAPRAAGYASASGRGREDSLTTAEIAAFMLRPAGPVGRGVPGSFRRAGPSDRLCFFGPRRLFGPSLSLLRRARHVRKTGNNPVEEPARGLPALLGIPRRRMRPEKRGRKQRDEEHGKSLNEHGKGHADQRQRKSCADAGRKDAPRAAQTFFQRFGRKSHHRALRCARAC